MTPICHTLTKIRFYCQFMTGSIELNPNTQKMPGYN